LCYYCLCESYSKFVNGECGDGNPYTRSLDGDTRPALYSSVYSCWSPRWSSS